MSENESSIEGTINAVSSLVDKVPVYQDAIQPVAKETGKALETVGRTVNVALLPIRGLVWGMERIEQFVHDKLTKKLENVNPDNIQTPDPSIAGPVIESLRFSGHKESLAELYANLLATSMDKNTAKTAHPGFVEIIRNMSGDEAKILQLLIKNNVAPIVDIRRENKDDSGGIVVNAYVCTIARDAECEHQDLIGSYLKNLERLGLVDIPRDQTLTKVGVYDKILNDPVVKSIQDKINKTEKFRAEIEQYYVKPSALGKLFISACVNNRDKT